MLLNLIAIGNKMPSWVSTGYQEYAKRLPKECQLKLIEIPAEKRGKNADTARILEKEGNAMLNAIPKNNVCIALDTQGKTLSTEQLASELKQRLEGGQDISLLIGGPEGFAPKVLEKVQQRWKLSDMTLPHPLVRVLLAEQLYRAWTILQNHPYHK